MASHSTKWFLLLRLTVFAAVFLTFQSASLAQNPKFGDALAAANRGDARAQFIVGMMFLTGDDTRQDISRGVEYLEKSARADIPPAMVALANVYDAGAGVAFDPATATQWRQRAADMGNPVARGQIADDRRMPGQRDFRRANTLVDLKLYADAVPYAQRAASAGSVNAGLLLGRAYHFGIGIPVNLAEAVRWYRQSADRGLEDAQRHLAYMYEFGLGVDVNRKTALLYYDRSAAQGDALARRAAANLRSPDYDRPPPAVWGGSSGSQCPNGYLWQPGNRCVAAGGTHNPIPETSPF